MNGHLIRTTSYLDPLLHDQARKLAIDEKKHFYEILNEALTILISTKGNLRAIPVRRKPFKFEEHFSAFSLGLKKKKITRADAYE
jgi:hypothetical protein